MDGTPNKLITRSAIAAMGFMAIGLLLLPSYQDWCGSSRSSSTAFHTVTGIWGMMASMAG